MSQFTTTNCDAGVFHLSDACSIETIAAAAAARGARLRSLLRHSRHIRMPHHQLITAIAFGHGFPFIGRTSSIAFYCAPYLLFSYLISVIGLVWGSFPCLVGYFVFLSRDAIRLYVSAVFAVALCPSVRPSRWWIVSRWLKISSNFFLGPVAPSF